jgi:hypothetical protein
MGFHFVRIFTARAIALSEKKEKPLAYGAICGAFAYPVRTKCNADVTI